MKVYAEIEQNTLAWLRLHIGIPTASGLDNLLDSSFKPRSGEMPKTYLHRKLAESWRGQPLVELGSSGSFSTEQGMLLEEEALPFWELETGRKVKRVGFVTTDDGKCGCSPDGLLIGEECGIEIKCPAAHTHVKYLMAGELPKEYVAQVHGSMFVTGYPKWIFMSYRRGFPALMLEVDRDETIISAIDQAVRKFHKEFDAGKARIAELNGK